MIFLYLALAAGLSILDISDMKKRGRIKDIYVFVGFMAAAAIFGVIYLSDTSRLSIATYILRAFNIKE